MEICGDNPVKRIDAIGTTSDTLTGRGGLALVMQYLDKIGIWPLLERSIGHLRFSGKGKAIGTIARQVVAAFIDGSDTSMSGFDRRRRGNEHAAILGYDEGDMVGGSVLRRFFYKFLGSRYRLFRPVLHWLFVWRLNVERPTVIKLYIDTMVLDNDQGLRREGCKPTYKKVKGFQPLQVHWGPYIVDMEFRSGEKHSNHGNGVSQSITELTRLIREKHDADVPIIVGCDSGFLSDANFQRFEDLGLHYVGMGKLYDYLYDQVRGVDLGALPVVEGSNAAWAYYEFGSRFTSYPTFRRTIFTTIARDGEQTVLRGVRPDSFIHTNIGVNKELDQKLIDAGEGHLLEAAQVISLAHENGAEELNHRSIKEFMGTERLPFKRFGMNGAYYYLMVIAHILSEAYRHDVAAEVLPRRSYPTTLRRTLIDFAAKIVTTGGSRILRVTRTILDELDIAKLWERCNNPKAIGAT